MDESTIRDHFLSVLELPPGASQEEIKAAHKKLVAKWHTDKVEHNEELKELANERLIEINEANECLTDPQKLRKFMSKAARTGWKPGQRTRKKQGASSGTASSESDDGAKTAGENRQSNDAGRQGQNDGAQQWEAFIAAQMKVKQAAVDAAAHLAKALRAHAPALQPAAFYNRVYAEAVAAAKQEAESHINRLQLSLSKAKILYDLAQQSGQTTAEDELAKYKLDHGGSGTAFLDCFGNVQQMKIAGIIIGLLVIVANADKFPQIWQEIKKPPAQEQTTRPAPSPAPVQSMPPTRNLLPDTLKKFAPPAEPQMTSPALPSTNPSGSAPSLSDLMNNLKEKTGYNQSPYDTVSPISPLSTPGLSTGSSLGDLLQSEEASK